MRHAIASVSAGAIPVGINSVRQSCPRLTLVSHHLCPYVQRAAIALAEKGVAFERITIDLAAKPDWFKAISPLGKVPLLRVARPGRGEAVLFESAVICEFIEETQAGAGAASERSDRARPAPGVDRVRILHPDDIYALETTPDAALFERKRQALTEKFARMEGAAGLGLHSSPASASAWSMRPSGRCSAISTFSTRSPISAS